MSSEKPLGWRPFTSEARQNMLKTFSEEQIAEMEEKNVYAPNATAVLGWELANALLKVARRRFGESFKDDVVAVLRERADDLASAGDAESEVEAVILRDLLEAEDAAAEQSAR